MTGSPCHTPGIFVMKNGLLEAFPSSDLAFGQTILLTSKDERGKAQAKHWTEKRAAGEGEWDTHIKGGNILGLSPINSENKCHWGALDIDQYSETGVMESVCTKLCAVKLPSMVTFSKSRGIHVFVLFSCWIPASLVQEKMQNLAGYLGHAAGEVFPKQTSIRAEGGGQQDYGNWISMPFWGGDKLRGIVTLVDREGRRTTADLENFLSHVKDIQITDQELRDFEIPIPDIKFPEGPPCLNLLFSERPEQGSRNILLANAAVYAKKAFPDSWEGQVMKYNAMFSIPLSGREVDNITKSYARKEYNYQCRIEPLKSHCSAKKCRACRFGIGHQTVLPGNQSLSMINTEPPIWYMDITLKEGTVKRISLSTEQLQNPFLFQKRCMEVLQEMPSVVKREDWEAMVSEMMAAVQVIQIPKEMTRGGQFMDVLEDFLDRAADEPVKEHLLSGQPVRENGEILFRLKDLNNYMNAQRFTLLPYNEVIAALKNYCDAQRRSVRIREKCVSVWCIEEKVFGQ